MTRDASCGASAIPSPVSPTPFWRRTARVSPLLEIAPTHSALASCRGLGPRFLPLRWRRSKAGIAGEIAERQAAADDVAERSQETPAIALGIAPLVEPERLLVAVPMEMEGVHVDVGALEP